MSDDYRRIELITGTVRRRHWSTEQKLQIIEESFEDAIQQGVARASKTLKNVQGAWIKEQQVNIENGRISGYRVNMMVTFVLDGDVGD